jgi:hypothetical protein
VDSGVLPAHEGATSRLSTVLWNAPGGGLDDRRSEVYKARLHAGDTLLLRADGLPTHVPDGDIHALLQAREPARETCRTLVEAANRAHGTDNTTVIVARLRDTVHDAAAAEEAAAMPVPLATPVPAEPECPAVSAAWTEGDAPGALRGGPRRAAATRIRHGPACDSSGASVPKPTTVMPTQASATSRSTEPPQGFGWHGPPTGRDLQTSSKFRCP